uniref:Uncharacterized protein n=1 Tax=Mola mola TaxID=94237 RepID=A0A3Q3W6M2_MOLML
MCSCGHLCVRLCIGLYVRVSRQSSGAKAKTLILLEQQFSFWDVHLCIGLSLSLGTCMDISTFVEQPIGTPSLRNGP